MASQCSQCSQTTLPEQLFCPHCGAALYPARERLTIQVARAEKAGRWNDALRFHEASLEHVDAAEERAYCLLSMGRIHRDHLDAPDRAMHSLFCVRFGTFDPNLVELDKALEDANAVNERKSLHKQRFQSVEHEDVVAALQGLMVVYGDDHEGLYEAISPSVDRFPGHHALKTQVALVAEQAGAKYCSKQLSILIGDDPKRP